MPDYLIIHRHQPKECPAAFAAWRGFDSRLRGSNTHSSCRWGGHEIWWSVNAENETEALGLLPRFLAQRAQAVRVGAIEIP
jgi:hypothetical protein